ncbi:ABC transporter ATP-binding protein [Natronococcus wangiae]|uniref:ABC transporter ATP-binding protein n=1 Tax=Natronococcus wangiae TaxID=3068275 RepID=UPI00273E5905|nr:ABC transporter ATP-binding protein [Natronococcus sp. AD5]
MIGSRERERDTTPRSIVSSENLVKSYDAGKSTVRAIDGVSLTVEAESIVGLLGPNGAGKTTLIKLLLGLITPTDGTVSIDGIDVIENPHRVHAKVAALLGGARSTYWRLTVRENLEFFSRLNGEDSIENREWLLQFLDRLRLTEKMDDVVNGLSRGEKQKVSLATTLAQDVDVLFLDEPMRGLDVESSFELQKILAELTDRRGVTILVPSHDMAVIETICDRAVVLDDGEIIADDSIDNLLEALQTRTYELIVEGCVSGSTRNEIERSHDVVSRATFQDHTKLEVAVSNANRVHDLTGVLVENDLQIKSIQMADTGVEAVFTSLVYDRSRVDDARTEQGGR